MPIIRCVYMVLVLCHEPSPIEMDIFINLYGMKCGYTYTTRSKNMMFTTNPLLRGNCEMRALSYKQTEFWNGQ